MDSVFTAVHRNIVLVDLVDEAWAADHLSDDEIDVPHMAGQDESDDLNAEQEPDEEKWAEMGLAEFQPTLVDMRKSERIVHRRAVGAFPFWEFKAHHQSSEEHSSRSGVSP